MLRAAGYRAKLFLDYPGENLHKSRSATHPKPSVIQSYFSGRLKAQPMKEQNTAVFQKKD